MSKHIFFMRKHVSSAPRLFHQAPGGVMKHSRRWKNTGKHEKHVLAIAPTGRCVVVETCFFMQKHVSSAPRLFHQAPGRDEKLARMKKQHEQRHVLTAAPTGRCVVVKTCFSMRNHISSAPRCFHQAPVRYEHSRGCKNMRKH